MEISNKEIESYIGRNLNDLKYEIAEKTIDLSGTMSEHKVLVRVIRGKNEGNLTLEFHKDGYDNYTEHERFWFEFDIEYFGDMPSGENVFPTDDGEFEIQDEKNKVIEKCDRQTLMEWLTDDLIERNHGHFNDNWNEFLAEFQKWIMEED